MSNLRQYLQDYFEKKTNYLGPRIKLDSVFINEFHFGEHVLFDTFAKIEFTVKISPDSYEITDLYIEDLFSKLNSDLREFTGMSLVFYRYQACQLDFAVIVSKRISCFEEVIILLIFLFSNVFVFSLESYNFNEILNINIKKWDMTSLGFIIESKDNSVIFKIKTKSYEYTWRVNSNSKSSSSSILNFLFLELLKNFNYYRKESFFKRVPINNILNGNIKLIDLTPSLDRIEEKKLLSYLEKFDVTETFLENLPKISLDDFRINTLEFYPNSFVIIGIGKLDEKYLDNMEKVREIFDEINAKLFEKYGVYLPFGFLTPVGDNLLPIVMFTDKKDMTFGEIFQLFKILFYFIDSKFSLYDSSGVEELKLSSWNLNSIVSHTIEDDEGRISNFIKLAFYPDIENYFLAVCPEDSILDNHYKFIFSILTKLPLNAGNCSRFHDKISFITSSLGCIPVSPTEVENTLSEALSKKIESSRVLIEYALGYKR